MVTLPDGVDACDIGTITVWCMPFRAIFTRLEVPRSTFVSFFVRTSQRSSSLQADVIAQTVLGQKLVKIKS